MTRDSGFVSLSDVVFKWATPIVFGVLSWNAWQFTNRLEKIEEKIAQIQETFLARVQSLELKSVILDERFNNHLQARP